MPRHLKRQEIEAARATLLREGRPVSVRNVVRLLKQLHGIGGRTERVAEIIRQADKHRLPAQNEGNPDAEIQRLRAELALAIKRAELAEEREEAHQHYWADRYADKLVELQQREERTRALRPSTVSSEQYLRVYQRMAEFERRLSEYESIYPDPRVPPP